jgi:DNA-nicking Smr family endonuclease
MNSRRREVSELEAAFFREVLKDSQPLKHKSAPRPAPKHSRIQMNTNPHPVSTLPLKSTVYSERAIPGIGGHRAAHVRKGRLKPEAKLDLHGYRQEAAYRAMQRFVMHAHGMGQRVVLIVTGKSGALRDMLPRWLSESEFRNLVVGISSAHAKHGGTGAFYVALKKHRAK